MRTWIVRQFIALSEVTGRPLPRLVRRLVPPATLERELAREHQLTQALRHGESGRNSIPESLVDQLDEALRGRNQVVTEMEPRRKHTVMPAWAMAAAAMVVLSGTVFMTLSDNNRNQNPPTDMTEPAPSEATRPLQVPKSPKETSLPGLLFQSVEPDLVFKPMEKEKDRLTADVTNAIQYMANSFLPDSYAAQVSENLRLLKAEGS